MDTVKDVSNLYNKYYNQIQDFIKDLQPNLKYASSITQFITEDKRNNTQDDKTARYVLLDLLVREKTEFKDGIVTIPAGHPLLEKLRSGFINNSSYKNAPASLDMTDNELISYGNKMEEFKGKQTIGAKIVNLLESILQKKFKDAILIIHKAKSEAPDGDLKGNLKIVKDSSKVIILYLTSMINSSIIDGLSYEEGILPCLEGIFYIFTHLVTDVEDNHYKQVIINLKTTVEVADTKITDYKDKLLDAIRILESKKPQDFTFENEWTPQYTETYHTLMDTVLGKNPYQWHEDYNAENLGVLYGDNFTKFKNSYGTWLTIHRNIYKTTNSPKQGDDYLESEKKENIDLKKFANTVG